MASRPHFRRRAARGALTVVAAALSCTAPAGAVMPERADFDARAPGSVPGPERARVRLREALGPDAAISADPVLGTLRSASRLDGFLTGSSARDGADVALDYARDHAAALGLHATDLDDLRLTRRVRAGGVEHLTWQQRVRGIPVADAQLGATLTASGRLMALTGPLVPDAQLGSAAPAVDAEAAYAAARRGTGAAPGPVAVTVRAGGAERVTRFADGGRAALRVVSRAGRAGLAWRVLAPVSATAVYDVLVDARTGAVVRRINRVDAAVEADVYPYGPSAPVRRVDLAPWLDAPATRLRGPNAHAFADPRDVVPIDPAAPDRVNLTPRPGSDVAPVGGDFRFALVPAGNRAGDGCPDGPSPPASPCTWDPFAANSWSVDRSRAMTQLFYLVNEFHDHLRDDPDIAFRAGSFERTAIPAGDPNAAIVPGASDPVLAQGFDGASLAGGLPDAAHTSNANFLTLPDGFPGLMQMYLFSPYEEPTSLVPATALTPTPFGAYHGGDDPSIVFHEYTHGLSNRLVVDADGYGALGSAQAGALGEGWSDFYALDYLEARPLRAGEADPLDDSTTPGEIRMGRYVDNGGGGVRRQALDCPVGASATRCAAAGRAGSGGFDYGDFGDVAGRPEVHADGEIWAQTLWDLRGALGPQRTRRYVTQAMRLSPLEPSFLDMRNAILTASIDPDDDETIWTVFARRGLGYFASAQGGSDVAPVADFTDRSTVTRAGTVRGTVRDQDGQPVAGAQVGFAGHDTAGRGGLGPELATISQADGSYVLDNVPTVGGRTFPLLRARRAGHRDARRTSLAVAPAPAVTQADLQLVRDWSSAFQGAAVEGFTGPDNSRFGCGPAGALDDDPGTVWGTSLKAGPAELTVDLGRPVDVAEIAIDPAAGCGDDPSAGLGRFELEVATAPDGPFSLVRSGAFAAADGGALRTAYTGDARAVRYVRLRALSAASPTGSSAAQGFVDVAELHVAKVPGRVPGPSTETVAAVDVGATAATLTGAVVAHGEAAAVSVEYGPTRAYGAGAAAGAVGPGEAPVPVAAAVGGLAPATTYHFRVVAERGGIRYPGADATFTTAPAAPVGPGGDPGPPAPPSRAAFATLAGAKLRADRRGRLVVRVAYAPTAPAGTARLLILDGRRRRLAVARSAVRPGRAVRVRVRLTEAGRRAVPRGRSRRVRVELRLPDGATVTRTLRLARRR